MAFAHAPNSIAAFFVGFGLLLAGGANVLLRRKSAALRIPANLLIVAVALGGLWLLTEEVASVEKPGLILVGILAIGFLAGSDRLASGVSVLAQAIRKPSLRWGFVAVAGIAIAFASSVVSDRQYERDLDRHLAELEVLSAPPPTAAPSTRASTDWGHSIEIREAIALRSEADLELIEAAVLHNPIARDRAMRSEPATDRSNCHGWAFAGGRFWISGNQVDRIVIENGYQPIDDPRPGDLVVYRAEGNVVHSGIVRYVSPRQPVLVASKWGCAGVFLHAVDRSIYGSSFHYYRSPRSGHLLAGLEEPVPHTTDAPLPTIPSENSRPSLP